MKRVTVYDKDEMVNTYVLNTIETKEFVDKLLSGTNFDILITEQEN